MGAGVVCSFASLEASEGPVDLEERDVRCRKSVTRKDVEDCEVKCP